MVCPEPGAITVLRAVKRRAAGAIGLAMQAWRERANAQATDEGQRSDCEERDSLRMPRVLRVSHHAGQRDRRRRRRSTCRKAGGVFLQAESEVAAINMLYGAASAGVRAMTASSGPGISLMQEGISYMAGAELPCVIADITRGGPGLGNIAAEQSDYHQVVKGGGHGNYRTIVLAPHSVQEMADLTALAFELADRYRNPVGVAGGWIHRADDGAGGVSADGDRAAAAGVGRDGHGGDARQSHHLAASGHRRYGGASSHLEEKYRRAERERCAPKSGTTEDAEIVLVGYGIVAGF